MWKTERKYKKDYKMKEELANLEYELSIKRNDINHFGYSLYEGHVNTPSMSYESLEVYVTKRYNQFKKLIEKYESSQHK